MKKPKMDLADFKTMELQAETQHHQAYVTMEVAKLLYEHAIVNIKRLGGMTNREEAEAAKTPETT